MKTIFSVWEQLNYKLKTRLVFRLTNDTFLAITPHATISMLIWVTLDRSNIDMIVATLTLEAAPFSRAVDGFDGFPIIIDEFFTLYMKFELCNLT